MKVEIFGLNQQKSTEGDNDKKKKERDVSGEFIRDDPEDDTSVRYQHEKTFCILFKLDLKFAFMLVLREFLHMAVIKDKVQDREFNDLIGDESVYDVHVVLFTKVTRCRDVKGLVYAYGDNGNGG